MRLATVRNVQLGFFFCFKLLLSITTVSDLIQKPPNATSETIA